MAFDVQGEYERLKKLYDKNIKEGKTGLPFECGCACGEVTKITFVPWHYEREEGLVEDMIILSGSAGFDYLTTPPTERTLFVITQKDCEKRYTDRKYRYDKKFNILEYFER